MAYKTKKIDVTDHDRRKPHSEKQIHIDQYRRRQQTGRGVQTVRSVRNASQSQRDIDQDLWGDGYGVKSRYSTPFRTPISDDRAALMKRDGKAVILNNKMFAVGGGGYGNTYCSVYVNSGKQGWGFYHVPVDAKGRVPLNVAAERLMDIADGDRGGRHRNVMIDFGETAKIQADVRSTKKEERAKAFRWYIHPNESDIKQLDTHHADLRQILSGKGKRKKHIVIVGGSEEQRKAVGDHIQKAFTIKEKKILAGTLFKIQNAGAGIAGYYSQPRDFEGNATGAPVICIDPTYAKKEETGVVVHECIHALRDHDKERWGGLKHVKKYRGKDKDLEESMTEAETRSRQKPYHSEDAGYYPYVPDPDHKGKHRLQDEDRITINAIQVDKLRKKKKKYKGKSDIEIIRDESKKGKRATGAVRKNYPKTNIAKMDMVGGVEAVDSFYEYEKQGKPGQKKGKVSVQTLQPKASSKDEAQEKAALAADSDKLYEWQDGKKVRVK